ncbi:glycosyltransferase [Thiohalocapsa marina]|uniref:Glycosyltransferase n=1 Tax=Thiohalocapsa marina TaxID=424902 RepID=A0A5M8FR94_9GAMM|nr:glycosyltransferase [Thiohalocapsa marina]KAA6186606.1 glycosyltransferase [Thiohalocapsa marina]
MTAAQVSVLLPYRDAAQTLPACIASIRAQTLEHFELLCIDDHSSDGGAELVAEIAREDPRIRPVTAPGHGLVQALNFGLQTARGGLVARMDADDIMHPRRLELQQRAMAEDAGLTVLASCVEAFADGPLTDGFRAYIDWQNSCVSAEAMAADIYLEAPVAHPSVMLRKARILAHGGYRDGDFPEDYELWLRLHQRGEGFGKLPKRLLRWRDHGQRLSRRDPRYARAAFDRLRADYLARDARLLAARDRLVIWGAGRKTRSRVGWLLRQGYRPRAWIDIDPRKIGNRLDGVPVVNPDWLRRRSPRPFVLSYVAAHGARPCIEAELGRLGYRKGTDYLHVG